MPALKLDPRLKRLLGNASAHHLEIKRAMLYSVLNKFLDLAPPLLIGLAVDIVVKQQDSYLATWSPDPLHQLYLQADLHQR